MPKKPDLSDYVEVNERIVQFYERYPDGSLQSKYAYEQWGDQAVVIVKARAYRHPTDPCPAVGLASEPIPGKTAFTKDSELMNAETSAWGRALAALGFEVKRSVASREEVRNRTTEAGYTTPTMPVPETPEVRNRTATEEVVNANRVRGENVQSVQDRHGDPVVIPAPNGKSDAGAAHALAQAANEMYQAIVEKHGKKEADRMVKMKLSEIGAKKLEDMDEEQARDFFSYLKGLAPAE